jgi:hypothetical protein
MCKGWVFEQKLSIPGRVAGVKIDAIWKYGAGTAGMQCRKGTEHPAGYKSK